MSRLTHKILVVDDDAQNISIISNMLNSTYHVLAAKTGTKALEIISSKSLPDLILLDVMLPDIDGYAICQKLKAQTRTRDLPIIFITAKDQLDDEVYGLEMGAVDYITKPVKQRSLLARIQTHLNISEQSRKQAQIIEQQHAQLSHINEEEKLALRRQHSPDNINSIQFEKLTSEEREFINQVVLDKEKKS